MAKQKTNSKKSKAISELSRKQKLWILVITWLLVLLPVVFIYTALSTIPEEELPSLKELEDPKSDLATQVFDIQGREIGKFFVSNRTKVDFQELSPYLVDALVATEDERFWEHSGVDGKALGRAILGAVTLRSKGGGSTLTQQLAKMMFHEPSTNTIKRIRQKFAEWIISSRLENNYTKKEIIAMYFNEFDFTNTAVGIHSASKVYFNKLPEDLLLQEAAVLVGMAKNPITYSPKQNPDNALTRRNTVLKQMLKNDYITQVQYDSISKLPIQLDFNPEFHNTGLAPYFRAEVKKQAKAILSKSALKNKYGKPYDINTDGLKIYTTLDKDLQTDAEWAIEEHLKSELQAALDKEIKNNKNYPLSSSYSNKQAAAFFWKEIKKSGRYQSLKAEGYSDEKIKEHFNTSTNLKVFDWDSKSHLKSVEMTPLDSIKYHLKILQAGLVSIDPHTGYVKAYAGGIDYRYFQFDLASQGTRQVGSTIKPFVYGAAIEAGVINECTEFPFTKTCIELEDGKMWCPGGESNLDGTITPVYWGLANSSNTITAKVVKELGGKTQRVVKYFDKMGMKNKSIQPVPSLALGSCDLSVLDITSAHAIFSASGLYHKPIFILRIEDDNGKILYEANTEATKVMNSEVAFTVLKMMKGVTGVKRPADGKWGGTAMRLKSDKPYAFKYTLAGKTGTTQNNKDGWFIGHTPDLITGVWVGTPTGSVRFKTTSKGQGANTALPIWGYYMQKVYSDKSIKMNKGDFIPPIPGASTVINCAKDSTITDFYFNTDDW